ncbi:MAG: hypothetical protein CL946_06365 [Ectothiorhodospiraceae bacterium]|nr:hypothetical protein [Ectothiorhodospiraceae bacterium]
MNSYAGLDERNRSETSIVSTFLLLGLLIVPSLALAQARLLIDDPNLEDYPFVKVPVEVRENNATVLGITKDHFSVFENGQQCTVIELTCEIDSSSPPVKFILVMDVSLSMRFKYNTVEEDRDSLKWKAAKAAIATVIQKLRPEDQATLRTLYRSTMTEVPFTSDRGQLLSALFGLSLQIGTNIYDTIYNTVRDVENELGRKVMILLTDGSDQGSLYTITQAIDRANRADIPIYVIGLDVRVWDEFALRRIAEDTNGDYHLAPSSEELQVVMDKIVESIYSQRCVLTYLAADTCNDGITRDVEVVATVPPDTLARSESYSKPDLLEVYHLSMGNTSRDFRDEEIQDIPIFISGAISKKQPIDFSFTFSFNPDDLEFRGISSATGVVDGTQVTYQELAPGRVEVRGADLQAIVDVPRRMEEFLCAMEVLVLQKDSIIYSDIMVDNVQVGQDCPAYSEGFEDRIQIKGCADKLVLGVDTTLVAPGGSRINVPVLLRSYLDMEQGLSYAFVVWYDSQLMTYRGFTTEETISSTLPAMVTETKPGSLYITASPGFPAMPTGSLITLEFDTEHRISSHSISMEFSDVLMAQDCIPDIEIAGEGILLDGDCNKVVMRKAGLFLSQNAPNPVSSGDYSTSFLFGVTGTDECRLEITDTKGETVAVLIDGKLEKGTYSARFDVGNLPSGLYMAVLREGEDLVTRKVLIER